MFVLCWTLDKSFPRSGRKYHKYISPFQQGFTAWVCSFFRDVTRQMFSRHTWSLSDIDRNCDFVECWQWPVLFWQMLTDCHGRDNQSHTLWEQCIVKRLGFFCGLSFFSLPPLLIFLMWCNFHKCSHFPCSAIPEGTWGTSHSLLQGTLDTLDMVSLTHILFWTVIV